MEENKKTNQEHGNKVLQLTVNGKKYEWHQAYITGAEIRKLGNIPAEDEIFLSIKKLWRTMNQLMTTSKVNLARPEIEHFYSNEKNCTV